MCGIQMFRSVIDRFSARLAEGQNRLEQIAIEKNLHCAVLQLSKASCDGETKSASLCVAGASPRTKRSVSSSPETVSSIWEMFRIAICVSDALSVTVT